MKALILSHAHPAYSIGGAQVAAYNLHLGLKQHPDWEPHFLAGIGPPVTPHRDTRIMKMDRGPDESLFWSEAFDWFYLATPEIDALMRDFERFLQHLQPDIVHFHHMMGFGLQAIRSVRRVLGQVPIVFTLHEYLPICANHGQMIKTKTHALCKKASPSECGMCFPEIGAGDMLRRELFIKRFFAEVDAFVSPSHFLISRYADWGIPRDRLIMIENGLEAQVPTPPRLLASGEKRNRFAFFGQLNPFKGIKVLVDAITRISPADWGDSLLYVYGGNLEVQPEEFQKQVRALMAQAGTRLRFGGSYRSEDLPQLMADIDWMIVPSTWWENAPVVIQEAQFHGRPIIASNIGGMAEKVRNGVDGLHFRVASGASLAETMVRASSTPGLWDKLHHGTRPPTNAKESGVLHAELYQKLLARRAMDQTPLEAAE